MGVKNGFAQSRWESRLLNFIYIIGINNFQNEKTHKRLLIAFYVFFRA